MGVGALLRRLTLAAAIGAVGVVVVAPAQARVPDLTSNGARALEAQVVGKAGAAIAKRQKSRRFRKGVWIPVPAAPGLVAARLEITLKKPAVSAARKAAGKGAKRPQKPIVTLRDRLALPRGLGATGSLWRADPTNRFVAAVAFAIKANRSASSGERVYVEVRSRVPIRKVRVRWERFRPRDVASRDFGKCLFNFGERARTQHFVKRIGGRLPDVYTAREVATAVTAANCGSLRGDFLEEIGFPAGTAEEVGTGGGSGGSGGGSGGGGGGTGGGSGGSGGGGSGGGSGGSDGGSGAGSGGGAGGGSGGGSGGGGGGGGDSNPFACEGIAAPAGIDFEYVVAVTCDENWTTLTVPKLSGNPWKAAESLDGAGTCTTPNGNVKCTLDAQPVHALVATSTSNIAVGSSTTATIGGLPGGVTANVPILFEDE